MTRLPFHAIWHRGCAAIGPLLVIASVSAGTVTGPSAPPEALALLYQQQLAACATSAGTDDRAACHRRAEALRAETLLALALRVDALRAQTERRENPGAMAENAMRRCLAQVSPDREACERMARGEGSASRSVEGGGTTEEVAARTAGPVREPAASAALR